MQQSCILGATTCVRDSSNSRRPEVLFTTHLAAIRRRKRFVPCRDTGRYAAELLDLLALLDQVGDPDQGVRLLSAFYRADAAIFANCDDSNGTVGDVFRLDARDRFAAFASRCDDKKRLISQVMTLVATDDYGVRDAVVHVAAQYLDPPELRALADSMWDAAIAEAAQQGHSGGFRIPSHWFGLVESIARQLNDPALFERARRMSSPELGTGACIHVAEAWLAAGDAAAALAWIERIKPGDHFMANERDAVLAGIFRQTNDRRRLEALTRRRFHEARSVHTLGGVLDAIGSDQREAVIGEASAQMAAAGQFNLADAVFLVSAGRRDEAAQYLVQHHAAVDGGDWTQLVPLADEFVASGHALPATVAYRALLVEILSRARQPAYGHAAKYLHTLDLLAPRIADWKDIAPHENYLEGLRAAHGRKSSFWKRYAAA
jgi:hypothetical protein